ncbi:MAG: hypothetical protein ACFNVH_02320 [Segatella maculosa]
MAEIETQYSLQLTGKRLDKLIVPRRTDARAVRPYIPTLSILMCKMMDRVGCSNACRDARSVRPPTFQLTMTE